MVIHSGELRVDTEELLRKKRNFTLLTAPVLGRYMDLPRNIVDTIIGDDAIVPETIEVSPSMITGSWEPVRAMVCTDYALDTARGAYEAVQGMTDFGWLQKQDENWKSPGIFLHTDDQKIRYDGQMKLVGSSAISFENSGMLPSENVTTLGTAAALFQAQGGIGMRDGGYGQELKVFSTVAVSSIQDRITAMKLHLADDKSGLTEDEKHKIKTTITELEHLPEVVRQNSNTFVTIQSKDRNGKYYRVYCVRMPIEFDEKPQWKEMFIKYELKEELLGEDQKDRVIITVHNPDDITLQAFSHMPENLLDCDPQFQLDSSTSLVRDIKDMPPPFETKTFKSDELPPVEGMQGEYQVTQIKGKPGVFFRNSRMKPQVDFSTLFGWNITDLDPKAIAIVNRTANSTRVSGPVGDIIRTCVANMTSQADWKMLLEEFQHAAIKGRDLSDLPIELQIKNTAGKNEIVETAIARAFAEVWPDAQQYFASSQEEIDFYNAFFQPKKPLSCPILPECNFSSFLAGSGVTQIKEKIGRELAEKLNFQPYSSTKLRYCILGPENEKYLRRNSGEKSTSEQRIYDFMQTVVMPRMKDANGIRYRISPSGGIIIQIKDLLPEPYSQISQSVNPFQSNLLSDPTQQRIRSTAIIQLMYDLEAHGLSARFERYYEGNVLTKLPDGRHLLVEGELTYRNETGQSTIRITGDMVRLFELKTKLDALTKGEHPEWSDRENDTDSQVQIEERIKELKRLEASLDRRTRTVVKRGSPLANNSAHDRIRRSSRSASAYQPSIDRYQGGANDATEMAFSSGSGGFIVKSKDVGRPPFESDQNGAHREERSRYRQSDYLISWYDQTPPDHYPLAAYELIAQESDKITVYNQERDYVPVLAPDNESVWTTYSPDTFYNHLNRNAGREPIYDGVIEFTKRCILHPDGGTETLLPIDGKKYQLVYIQLPLDDSEEAPNVPSVLYDRINQQYSLQFREGSDALSSIPPGTRLYVKKRTEATGSDEAFLMTQHPDYYQSLAKPVAKIENLDFEAQQLIRQIQKLPLLTRSEKVSAIYRFWEKRRRYDDQGIKADSIEKLIESGIGECIHAAVPYTDLLRLAGVPCRLRIVYLDNHATGRIQPPTHLIVEVLDDQGMWTSIDPPNAKVTEQFAAKVAYHALTGTGFSLIDAPELERGMRQAPEVPLPSSLEDTIAQMSDRQGIRLDAITIQMMVRMLEGEWLTPEDEIDLRAHLAVAYREAGYTERVGQKPERALQVTTVDKLAQTYAKAVGDLNFLAQRAAFPESLRKRKRQEIARRLAENLVNQLIK